MSGAVQTDLGCGPARALLQRRKLHQNCIKMLRTLFFPNVVTGISGEERRVIEVAADQLLQSNPGVAIG